LNREYLHAGAIAAAFTLLAAFVSIYLLYCSFEAAALDLGLFTQTLRYTLEGKILYTTIDQASFLADHFSPVLLLMTPIYWLFPYAQTLLVVQAIVLGAGVYLSYVLARSFGFSHKTSILVEVLFSLNPLLWGLVMFDFHPVAFAVPALLLMFIGMVRKRQYLFFTGFIFALLTKEIIIMALAIFGFARIIIVYVKEKHWERQSLIILGISLTFYGLAVLTAAWASDWEFPPKMLQYTDVRYGFLKEPMYAVLPEAIRTFMSAESIFMLMAYLLPFAFLPLLSPGLALPGLFILATNMLATYTDQRANFHQYAAPALPFLYAAFLYSLIKIRGNIEIQQLLNRLSPRLAIYCLESLLIASLLFNISPTSRFWQLELPDSHDKSTREIIALIPDGTTVTAQNTIFPHLCNRTEVFLPHWVGKASFYDEDITWGYPERFTEYVIIDWTKLQLTDEGFWEDIVLKQIHQKYDSIAETDNVQLFRLR